MIEHLHEILIDNGDGTSKIPMKIQIGLLSGGEMIKVAKCGLGG